MGVDPQNPRLPFLNGLAYSALGAPDMALAYFDLAKALTALDNTPGQKELIVEKAVVRLVSGKDDAHQVAELLPLPSGLFDTLLTVEFGVFVDLATARPEDALTRMEAFVPECIGATEIPIKLMSCPSALVRVYQELGDQKAAKDLSDLIVDNFKVWVHEYPVVWVRFQYAGSLATAGRTDEALDVLEDLVSSGWRGDYYIKHLGFILCCDVRFDAIRAHERFQAIAATIESDMAQQLENVRAMENNGEIPTLEEVRQMTAAATDTL